VNNIKAILLILYLLNLISCSSANILTEQQRTIQNNADREVATVLFDQNITNLASYKVHSDGLVVISFDKKITEKQYTTIVNSLRNNKFIHGVSAEQQGIEVCPNQ